MLVKKEWLKTEIALTFEGWVVVIRYCAWGVLGRNFISEWWGGRGRSGGSIGGGGMSKILGAFKINYERPQW